MLDTKLNPRELELVTLIHEWEISHRPHEQVQRAWLRSRMYLSNSRLSELLQSLRRKGWIENGRRIALTEEARQLLNSRPISLAVQIPLVGEVKAGRTQQDDIQLLLPDISRLMTADALWDSGVETLAVPDISPHTKVFALQVVGDSMEHETIFEGDYVIVQAYGENEGPREGELIVTKYLASADEKQAEDHIQQGLDIPDDLRSGPTLKFYFERRGEEWPIQLGWKKDRARSEFTIVTKVVWPIGRVVGIYRHYGDRPRHTGMGSGTVGRSDKGSP